MNSKNALAVLCILFLIIIVLISFIIDYKYKNKYKSLINETDTIYSERIDTVYKTDTFKIKELIPKEVVKLRTDTVYDSKGNEIELVTENKLYQDTLICGKDTAELQIFTSGIKSNVDSVNLSLRKSEIIKTNTVEITKYIEKPKSFWEKIHIQPQATSGYDIVNKQWGVTIGIGVGITL